MRLTALYGTLFILSGAAMLAISLWWSSSATLAVADGDYAVILPVSGRDEVGRLEANFTTMTRQLGSALAAERQRALTGHARDLSWTVLEHLEDGLAHLLGEKWTEYR
jgi:nitrogen fixation/metabolism regulation signal transduction histidine kinase